MTTATYQNPVREAIEYAGSEGIFAIKHKDQDANNPLKIPVRIIEGKFVYGHIRLLVEPLHGEGRWWVDVSKVQFPR
jgi:hypothetical protein